MVYSYDSPGLIGAIIGVFGAFTAVIGLIFGALAIAGMWMVFKKAGEKGWLSIIPFVNVYKLYKIGWGNGWLFLLLFIPIANIVVSIMLCIKIARAFGKGTGFAVGLILLPSIFFIILGLGDATYYGPVRN